MKVEIRRVFNENFQVYGVRKVWRQLQREGYDIARRIVGWRASRTAHASFVLDAVDQALHDRRPAKRGGLVHNSDRGSQGIFNRAATP